MSLQDGLIEPTAWWDTAALNRINKRGIPPPRRAPWERLAHGAGQVCVGLWSARGGQAMVLDEAVTEQSSAGQGGSHWPREWPRESLAKRVPRQRMGSG